MKKRHVCIGVLVFVLVSVLLCLWFIKPKQAAEDVLAQVNGVSITEQQVANRMKVNQIRNQAYTTALQAALAGDDRKEAAGATDEKGALRELIEGEVIRHQVAQDGTLLSREQAQQQFDREYALLKTNETQKTFYDCLNDAFVLYEVNEDEYIRLSYDFAYDAYNTALAKAAFVKSEAYSPDAAEDSDSQFALYINDLVEQANFAIMTNLA